MGKRRSWFSLVKKLFVSDPQSNDKKKSKSWRWFFGGVKPKQYPKIAAPERMIDEVREEQRNQVVAVAIATAAAAEAAVAAARAAAEVVQLTGVPQSYQGYEKRTRNWAAIKIQAAYRAHLARKALKALKGLVRLQAVVRGRIVRRRVITKLKYLPPIAKTQSQVRQVRLPNVGERCKDGEKKQLLSPRMELEERKTKLRCKSQKNWDYSLFPKEDIEALWLQKQEAYVKRERMKNYSSSHREMRNEQNLETLVSNKEYGRWSNQLDRRVESEACRRRELSNLKSTVHSSLIAREMMKQRNGPKQDSIGDLNSPYMLPRRSFSHAKQKSIRDESSLPNSPSFPAYMAATESAKAKARSMSTPRQRMGLFDTYNDYNSPHKLRISSWSTFNGEFSSKNGERDMKGGLY
ncbi:Protein IQ-DOMAIN like [Actinidia chinensis var. chinensis]|uniref:Protein IQ-DOMAIN like n=1 Tax=Actinidia chinensis var. chinensis TaxID=1590841 RepID=A0A2R6QVB8_ACTCC|nr:Protein IQ-DOMAIN like [Actinidia chinensis var. chinensis]